MTSRMNVTILCPTSLRAMYGTTALVSSPVRFRNLMASVAQNVRENPQRAPCNNNETEFEKGWQNAWDLGARLVNET